LFADNIAAVFIHRNTWQLKRRAQVKCEDEKSQREEEEEMHPLTWPRFFFFESVAAGGARSGVPRSLPHQLDRSL
jgi:hypothetical protein